MDDFVRRMNGAKEIIKLAGIKLSGSDEELVMRTYASMDGGYPYGFGALIEALQMVGVDNHKLNCAMMYAHQVGYDSYYGPPRGYDTSAYDGQHFGKVRR